MNLINQDIPKIGLVMESVRITRWLKNVGDRVTQGEPLVEVETEKSMVEIEAAASGRLAEILVQAGQEATVGDAIAQIESEDPHPNPLPQSGRGGKDPHPNPLPLRGRGSEDASRETLVSTPSPASRERVGVRAERVDRMLITPVARKLATEHGLDISNITGTGPRGRIQLEDIERALRTPATGSGDARSPGAGGLSPMRRALARAMTLSNATVPQFFVERSVDWTTLQTLRAEFSAKPGADGPKLSVNDFLLQGLARVLLELPALNSTFSGEPDSPEARIVPADGAHIGLVVAVDDGLLVPVLHRVEQLGLGELARRREECVARALQGRLRRDELDGATISLSNLGAHGPDRFTAIINPPQSAILAVGRQRECPVARNGGIEIRPMSVLTLTVDHRVADGRLASQFLARLVEILEGRDFRI